MKKVIQNQTTLFLNEYDRLYLSIKKLRLIALENIDKKLRLVLSLINLM